MPKYVASTSAFVERLSDRVEGGRLPYPVEQLVLRWLVDQLDCPLCLAPTGTMCYTYGAQNLRRTHLPRLQRATPRQIDLAIQWAILEHQRQLQEE